MSVVMQQSDRLFHITRILKEDGQHRASDIARALGVSQRTIYRDMDRLVASGLPLTGTRGEGYRLGGAIPLPPLTLSPSELEALTLGLGIVMQAGDDVLRSAATTLSRKVETATSTQAAPHADLWRYVSSPYADATRNLTHMKLLRSAIRARQKVRLTYTSAQGSVTSRIIRPLKMEYWGHAWAMTAWCELRNDFRMFRLDLIESTEALPELFVDEPGKLIEDFNP